MSAGRSCFTPDRAGQITPNHRLGNTWNVTINTNQSAKVIDDIRYLQMLGASA